MPAMRRTMDPRPSAPTIRRHVAVCSAPSCTYATEGDAPNVRRTMSLTPRSTVAHAATDVSCSSSHIFGWPMVSGPGMPGSNAVMSSAAASAVAGSTASPYGTCLVTWCPPAAMNVSYRPSAFSSATPHGAIHSPRTRSRYSVVFSSTSARLPARASAVASAPPAIPPPTITMSNCSAT
jgi:hypothetical protein